MTARALLLFLPIVVGACSGGTPSAGAETPLTESHVGAMRDSVQRFLDAYAADLSAPPVGKNVREALAPFYASDIVMSMDLAPEQPVVVQSLDSLVPAEEVVTVPAWIRSTKFTWGTTVITPLAPGMATYTAKYVEQVTDTTGTTTDLPGVQHGVLRNGTDGWRFIAIQSSHPMTTHTRQAELNARFQEGK